MNEILNTSIFVIGDTTITLGQILVATMVLVLAIIFYRIIIHRFFPHLSFFEKLSDKENKKLRYLFLRLLGTVVILIVLSNFNLDFSIYKFRDLDLSFLLILRAIIFYQIAGLFDWLMSNLFKNRYYLKKEDQPSSSEYIMSQSSTPSRIFRTIYFVLLVLFLMQAFNVDYTIFNFDIQENGEPRELPFKISKVVVAILIIIIARLIVWIFTQLILFNIYRTKKIDLGSQFAINQLITYVVFVFAIILALQELGINMTLLLGGAAALLVGIGLGLQQTFNDFISGIVLLFERSVSIGDVLEFEGTVGTIKRIGLRASLVETRENISLVVPNRMLVNNKVINWTHYNDKIRFKIEVGVAYGSDTALIKNILLDVVKKNPFALEYPSPLVRLEGFGESSLDFGLYFFSRNYMVIEDIKSDIRLEIDREFRKNKVVIPFPQRDLHFIDPIKKDAKEDE